MQGCPPFLFYFRFVGESDAPLSLSHKRQTVTIELSTFSARRRDGRAGHNGMHIKFARLHDEIVQMTLCKYEGRPHWALATNRLFLGPCHVRDHYGNGESRRTCLHACSHNCTRGRPFKHAGVLPLLPEKPPVMKHAMVCSCMDMQYVVMPRSA